MNFTVCIKISALGDKWLQANREAEAGKSIWGHGSVLGFFENKVWDDFILLESNI